jgi:DNA-binding response OmpR family regulator
MTASLSDGIETAIDIFILSANAPLSDQLEKQLHEEGYYVTLFSDGAHLLETLRNGKPNMLMCDATVPEADAFEVCRQIKADDYLWNIPVLVITGASDLKDLLSVLDCNADNFIAYPFDPAYLMSLVEGTLTAPVERPTPDQIKTQFKIKHDDQVFVVTADRRKLLEFLLSSFEIAVNKSADLFRATEDNRNLGTTIRNLEDTVSENTKVIGIINETLKLKEQAIADLTGRLADREQALREKIADIDQLTTDLSSEKTACEDTRSELRRVEQEKAESVAAHQATIDQLQRQVAEISSELAMLKPALEQARAGLAQESAVRIETEATLNTTTAGKEQAEKALSTAVTELEQLKINLGTETNRAQDAEQELRAVLQAKTQSEQDLTAIINELKETASEQAAAVSRLKEDLETERGMLRQAGEDLKAVTAAKEESESSLRATIEETLRTGKSDLAEVQARSEALKEAAEQELASVSASLSETRIALDEAMRTISSQKEDFARVSDEKEKAGSLAETLNESLKGLQDQLALEKDRSRELEARMNAVIREKDTRMDTVIREHGERMADLAQEHDREIASIRAAHDDTRTALSSHEAALDQVKQDLATAAAAQKDLEEKLGLADEKARRSGEELEEIVQAREQDRQKFDTLSENLERVKTSLEQETLRRQEAEDQLRDALAQQQHLEQDIERLVAETKALHADLTTGRRMLDDSTKHVRSLEDRIEALNREKHEAEEAAAHLSHEIDQARVALTDEPDDHTGDTVRPAAVPELKPLPPRPAPFAGVRKEAEIIKKRSLIVKTPTIPSEIRPLPRSMVAVDPVKTSGFDTPAIRSVEDLYEDDVEDQKKVPTVPSVSIVQEPAIEPVQNALPDSMDARPTSRDSFFEEMDDTPSDEESPEDGGSPEPSTGQTVTLDREQWLDLLKWSHHCEELTQDQRMHIVRLGRLIQKGRRLTRNQEEQVAEMLALVQRLGYHTS